MPSYLYDDSNRVGSDCCEKQARDIQNKGIADYALYQYLPTECESPNARFPSFSYDHVNLHGRVGYGFADDCVIDSDSAFRNNPAQLTRDRCPIQLFQRVFQGCPNLKPGAPNPDQEMPILQGTSSTSLEGVKFACKRTIMEMTTNKPIPLVPCMQDIQDPNHLVEPWVRGGDTTRDYVKRKEYLQSGCMPR
jgi:hypothetical protein